MCNDDVIAPRERPLGPEGGVAVLRGNLAPDGAVIKHTAAEQRLLQHAGPAVVFRNYDDLAARIDDPHLPVTADSVLVLQDAGPLGAPGMPEWGMLPIPKKLLAQGVRDMVRISDARMSGTPMARASSTSRRNRSSADRWPSCATATSSSSTCRPTSDASSRRRGAVPPAARMDAAAGRSIRAASAACYALHVTQADQGCDFDFLEGTAAIADPEIH